MPTQSWHEDCWVENLRKSLIIKDLRRRGPQRKSLVLKDLAVHFSPRFIGGFQPPILAFIEPSVGFLHLLRAHVREGVGFVLGVKTRVIVHADSMAENFVRARTFCDYFLAWIWRASDPGQWKAGITMPLNNGFGLRISAFLESHARWAARLLLRSSRCRSTFAFRCWITSADSCLPHSSNLW